MDEDQHNWKEITNIMMKIKKTTEKIFNTFHVMDQVRNFNTILK